MGPIPYSILSRDDTRAEQSSGRIAGLILNFYRLLTTLKPVERHSIFFTIGHVCGLSAFMSALYGLSLIL